MSGQKIGVSLNVVIMTVKDRNAEVLILPDMSLPCGPLNKGHRSFEEGLRSWLKLPLGYIEQLYTFGSFKEKAQKIDISYFALARAEDAPKGYEWSSWYDHFPWEDHRTGMPSIVINSILPALNDWKNSAKSPNEKKDRTQRIEWFFPREEKRWNEELVLQRYELLYEAGLLSEVKEDGRKPKANFGLAMQGNSRKILATAVTRLRAKIKYRPVVFELMEDTFTLFNLQNVVEALAGLHLHKQNFRRTVVDQGLVEVTKGMHHAKGRPAKLYIYRPEVLQERALAGTKLPRVA